MTCSDMHKLANKSIALVETLFVVGGTLDEGISAAVFGFSTASKVWRRFPDLRKARACHRAVFAQEREAVVVVGGSNEWPSPGFGECEILQLNAAHAHYMTWQPLPSLRHARSCHGLCHFGGKVYACAGMMNPGRARGHGIEQFDLTGSCEVLDLSDTGQGWREFPKLNLERFGLQLLPVPLGTKTFLLAIGGRGPHPAAEYSVEAFELGGTENKWTLLKDTQLQAPRIDFAAALAEERDLRSVDVVILGGNRVTRGDESDSSRTWEILRLELGPEGKLGASILPGGRLPSSRVGCRATVLQRLLPGKQHLAVAGGFRAWGEGQVSYGGPLDQSVAVMEIKGSGSGNGTAGSWVDFAGDQVGAELQNLPIKLHAPAVCTGLHSGGESAGGGEKPHKEEL